MELTEKQKNYIQEQYDGLKNDEQLIKMANIAQKALSSNKTSEEGYGMSEDEKTQLLSEIKQFNSDK